MTKIIETRNISKRYVMGEEVIDALKNISISVDKGEYVAFMGPSGSGKSTLMNIVGCLDTPSTGKYILNGHDVSEMSENELAAVRNKEIGFVFQFHYLLNELSAIENILLPARKANQIKQKEDYARELLTEIGLADKADRLPANLSGGEQQRVVIARALINHPEVILADEPTGNLDPDSSVEVMNLLMKISKTGTAVLMATHDYRMIEKFPSRIIKCENGKIVEDKYQWV